MPKGTPQRQTNSRQWPQAMKLCVRAWPDLGDLGGGLFGFHPGTSKDWENRRSPETSSRLFDHDDDDDDDDDYDDDGDGDDDDDDDDL